MPSHQKINSVQPTEEEQVPTKGVIMRNKRGRAMKTYEQAKPRTKRLKARQAAAEYGNNVQQLLAGQ